ncbi:MAG: shikimate kinase [Roseburia sp.]|nr:shikimate kinase [Roseburia sp.]
MNIVLCGMMGCGKTSVAEELEKLGHITVDTDALIVERYGEINKIFDERGEQYFREIEAQTVAEVAEKYNDAVISLGGGCVLRAQNVKNLKESGKIFYLRAKCETLEERLKGDITRPLLRGNLKERINTVLSAREKIYAAAADFTIDTDGLTPRQIAMAIREKIL